MELKCINKALLYLEPNTKSREQWKQEQNGEFFTPPFLICEMLSKLEQHCPTIYTDPTHTFLDPAAGIGNFPLLLYFYLMCGLEPVFPDLEKRRRHIIENMLYFCDIDNDNVLKMKNLFQGYKINLFHGDFLSTTTYPFSNPKKFTVILANPPYNPPRNKTGKGVYKSGKALWPQFVVKSLELLQEPNGYLVMVHPSLWRKPNHFLHQPLFSQQIHFLSLHTRQEGFKTFGATTRYDWYVLQKTKPFQKTQIVYDDHRSDRIWLNPKVPFIFNHCGEGHFLQKLLNQNQNQNLQALKSCEGSTQKTSLVQKQKSEIYCFPLVNSVSFRRGINLVYSSKPTSYQQLQKVIFSNGEVIRPFYDSGKFGTTTGGIFIPVQDKQEADLIISFLQCKIIRYYIAAVKWSNFETNIEIFYFLPHPQQFNLKSDFSDQDVYDALDLTVEERLFLENNISKSTKTFMEETSQMKRT